MVILYMFILEVKTNKKFGGKNEGFVRNYLMSRSVDFLSTESNRFKSGDKKTEGIEPTCFLLMQ